MKRFPLSLLLLLALLPFRAVADGTDASLWTYHLAYHRAQQVVGAGRVSYGVFNGNLLAYDVDDHSVREFDKRTGLSDKGIRWEGYSSTQHCLVLYYESNNVDLLYDDGSVVNIPQIKQYADYVITPSNLNVCGDWATVSTSEGVILLDLKRREVKAYYRIMQAVNDAVVQGNYIYAGVGDKVMRGLLTDNLYSYEGWQEEAHLMVSSFVQFGSGFYMLAPAVSGQVENGRGVYYAVPSSTGTLASEHISDIYLDRGTATGQTVQFVGSWNVVLATAEQPTRLQVIPFGRYLHSVSATSDGTYWLADLDNGMRSFRLSADGTQLEEQPFTYGNFGPYRDLSYKLTYQADGGKLLVAGGRTFVGTQPTAMIYENGNWQNLDTDHATLNDGVTYYDVNSIAQDPKDQNHYYVGFYGGVAEYEGTDFVKHYGSANSGLQYETRTGLKRPQYTFAFGLTFDDEGNLWVLNAQTDSVVKVMKTDGTWCAMKVDGLNKNSTVVEKMLFDEAGRVWITSRNTTSAASGLACLDYDGTLDDPDDDESLFRSTATNEDGTRCDISGVCDLALDRNGQLWFGCLNGVFAVENPGDWFSSSFTVYQPKVPRNDGTNYADYLLTGVNVTAVAVDGGNRKWLGTMGSGVYVVSPDGTEVVEHFTTENSPLLSDNIYSIALHPVTGEAMIGTDQGLCSYRSGVTRPYETLAEGNIKVYPNPVRPEYQGRVTITGLSEGVEVKILSANGQLVRRGNATGGSYLWDVCNAQGSRVAAGVYYIMLSTSNGGNSVAAKMVVI